MAAATVLIPTEIHKRDPCIAHKMVLQLCGSVRNCIAPWNCFWYLNGFRVCSLHMTTCSENEAVCPLFSGMAGWLMQEASWFFLIYVCVTCTLFQTHLLAWSTNHLPLFGSWELCTLVPLQAFCCLQTPITPSLHRCYPVSLRKHNSGIYTRSPIIPCAGLPAVRICKKRCKQND